MITYRKSRTITGKVFYVKETAEEKLNRHLLTVVTALTPAVMIPAFAKAAGMI